MKMDINNCIAELLSLHDCVIIPGFGGFIGNYSPARIDPVHHSFQPPTKNLLFNINLRQNDGLLANSIASATGTSYSEACRMIDEFAENCRLTLKSGNSFMLPQVGTLYPGQEGIIYFDQDHGSNLLPEAFGLASFISPPVIRSSSTSRQLDLSNRNTGPTAKKILPRVLKWAAVIAIPIGIATIIGMTQYDKLSANFTSNAGMLNSLFSRFSAASLVEKKEAPVKVIHATPKPVVKAVVEEKPEPITSQRFAVIVGAFRIQENAEKLISQLQQKGINAAIFDQSKTGLYRVTIGTSSTRTDALKLLASAKSREFNGAWLLSK